MRHYQSSLEAARRKSTEYKSFHKIAHHSGSLSTMNNQQEKENESHGGSVPRQDASDLTTALSLSLSHVQPEDVSAAAHSPAEGGWAAWMAG
jgi:hypothetical protein